MRTLLVKLVRSILWAVPLLLLAAATAHLLWVWVNKRPYYPRWPLKTKVIFPGDPEWSRHLAVGIALPGVVLLICTGALGAAWYSGRNRPVPFTPYPSTRRESLRHPRRYGRR